MCRRSLRLGLLLLAASAALPHAARAQDKTLALEPGRAVERRLAPGEVHRFAVSSTAGRAWRLRAR